MFKKKRFAAESNIDPESHNFIHPLNPQKVVNALKSSKMDFGVEENIWKTNMRILKRKMFNNPCFKFHRQTRLGC